MADIGKIVGISDFIVTLMGRVAKTASCITFIMYVTIKLILSTFINIKEKDNFTLWISLIAFLITMLLQV